MVRHTGMMSGDWLRMRSEDWYANICNDLVFILLMVDSTFTCTLHCTLPVIRMGARLLLMASGVDESLCAQLNSITGGTNSFVRVLTYTACDK